jgi:RNA polymerase sigma factor (sigma-70 family)
VYLKTENRRYTMKNEKKRKSSLGPPPEARLFEQAQGRCQASLNLLLERHEPLVRYAANRQNLGDLPFEEAVQAGRMGLWKALLGYDPQRGYQFSTYAYPAIVHYIWRAVKAHCVANKQAHSTREWAVFFHHWEAGPVHRQAEQELQVCLRAMVQRLPERLQYILRRRYALDGEPLQTLAAIGQEMGLTKERIRQLQVEALVRLRHPAYSQELRTLLQRHSQQEYKWAEEIAQAWLRRRGGRHGSP